MVAVQSGIQPRLSIVTPIFNGAAHIAQCMDNVRDQQFDNWEHVIADGGSTDGTVECIRERMQRDPRVRLLEGPDHGQSHAINKGIMAAQGAIIGILNADDEYKPGTLALAARMFENAQEPAFLWGSCEVIVYHTDRTDVWVQHPGKFETWRMALGASFQSHPVNPAAYFYHRSLHFAAGFYDETEHFAMDLEFLLRAPRYVRQFMMTDTVLGTFHLAPGTKTWADGTGGTSDARAKKLYARSLRTLNPTDRLKYEVARARLAVKTRLSRPR